MLIKTIAGISLFALAGGAIGYSKILCMTGDCAITGTPYGGALFGGVLGLAVMSSFGGTAPTFSQSEKESERDTVEDTDTSDSM